MQTKIKIILKILLLVVILTLPALVFAKTTSPLDNLEAIANEDDGYAKIEDGENDLISQAGNITNAFLSILGVIFIIIVIYGGYTYMTAGGDQGKVDKGINIIRRGIIGVLITIGAFAISSFVFNSL